MTQTCPDQLIPSQILHGEMPVTVNSGAYQEATQGTVMVIMVIGWKRETDNSRDWNYNQATRDEEQTKTTLHQQILFLLKQNLTAV